MTRDELNRRRMMFQIYSNRNKMPQIQKNTNEEPVAHSATNDFLEYRKKVAAGTRMQRENNTSNLFNVTAANEQYHQDLMDQNIIIHAGMTNQYIAKLDDSYGKGKPRYFYDQAEWDNYRKNMQGARQAGADRATKEGAEANAQKNEKQLAQNTQAIRNAVQSFKDTKTYNEAASKTNNETKKYFNNIDNTSLAEKANTAYNKSWTDSKRNKFLNDAQSGKEEAIKNSQKNANRENFLEANKSGREASMNGSSTKAYNDAKNKDLTNKAQEAFNNSPAANTEFRTSTDAYKNKDLLESNQKSKENAVKRSDPEYQKELDKARSIKEDKDRWGAYSESDLKEISKDKRFSNIKTEDDAVNYLGGVEKLYNDVEAALEEKFPGKKKNYEASKNAGADRGAKEKENAEKDIKKSSKTLANDYTADNASYKAMVSEVAKAIENGEVVMVGDAPRPVMDSNWKISENGQKAYDAWAKVMSEVNDAASNTENYSEFKGQILKNLKKDLSTVKEKEAKHSSLEDGITTSDDTTSDQEYLNFRARVEAGMKHFGMTRGLMSVPVNQALKNGESLSHAGYKPAGTHEYVAKIDNAFGPGKHRYFYSKEEWDNYQKYKKNEDYAKNAGARRKTMNNFEFYSKLQQYKSNTIAHSADFKYYQKIDLGNGKSRYFYTKEDWDAYNNPKKKKIYTVDSKDNKVVEYDEDGNNARKLNTTFNQHRQGAIMEADKAIERTAKESGMKAGINALLKDDRMEEFFTQFEGGFENHGWDITQDGKITGMSDDDKEYVKGIENWARKFTDKDGNSLFESKDFQDAVMKEIRNRYKIAQELKNDPDREAKLAKEEAEIAEANAKSTEAMNKALDDVHNKEIKSDKAVKSYTEEAKTNPKKVAKQIYKNRDFGLDELFYEVKEAIKDGAMIWDGSDLVAVSGSKQDKQKYNEANEHVLEIYRDMQKYIDSIAEDSGAGVELWREFRTLMTDKFERLSNKYAPSNSK